MTEYEELIQLFKEAYVEGGKQELVTSFLAKQADSDPKSLKQIMDDMSEGMTREEKFKFVNWVRVEALNLKPMPYSQLLLKGSA